MLPTLDPGYDVAFFDGHTPVPALHLALGKLLRTGGVLITANLNHGGTADAVAKALFDGKSWRSALVDDDGETAISVKLERDPMSWFSKHSATRVSHSTVGLARHGGGKRVLCVSRRAGLYRGPGRCRCKPFCCRCLSRSS